MSSLADIQQKLNTPVNVHHGFWITSISYTCLKHSLDLDYLRTDFGVTALLIAQDRSLTYDSASNWSPGWIKSETTDHLSKKGHTRMAQLVSIWQRFSNRKQLHLGTYISNIEFYLWDIRVDVCFLFENGELEITHFYAPCSYLTCDTYLNSKHVFHLKRPGLKFLVYLYSTNN